MLPRDSPQLETLDDRFRHRPILPRSFHRLRRHRPWRTVARVARAPCGRSSISARCRWREASCSEEQIPSEQRYPLVISVCEQLRLRSDHRPRRSGHPVSGLLVQDRHDPRSGAPFRRLRGLAQGHLRAALGRRVRRQRRHAGRRARAARDPRRGRRSGRQHHRDGPPGGPRPDHRHVRPGPRAGSCARRSARRASCQARTSSRTTRTRGRSSRPRTRCWRRTACWYSR